MTKLSFDPKENIRVFRQMKYNIANSKKLQELHLTGLIIREEGWDCLAYGVKRSACLKRFAINNCNLTNDKNFQSLAVGLCESSSIEYLDF